MSDAEILLRDECDRLRSSYDDIRALNVQITINCATERAAKDAEIAKLETGTRALLAHVNQAIARAVCAEARIAELEPLEHSFETILEAKCLEVSQRLISRAEKAEAECKTLRELMGARAALQSFNITNQKFSDFGNVK